MFAGQQQTYKEEWLLEDLCGLQQSGDHSDFGNIQVFKWEALNDWFHDSRTDIAKKAIKLFIGIRSSSNVVTNVDGKFFLTVPKHYVLWEGKYELVDVGCTDESKSTSAERESIWLSNGKN